MDVQTSRSFARPRPPAVRAVWAVLFLLLAAFAVVEAIKHGWPALVGAVLFFALPDLTLLMGTRRRRERARPAPRAVPYYNALHRTWVPLVLLVVCTFMPWFSAPVFAALLGWLAHIALDRAAGYGLRSADGSLRALGGRPAGGCLGTGGITWVSAALW